MCMEKNKKNKNKNKKTKHSKQSFRSIVLEDLSQDTFLGSCDGHWPFFMTLQQSWFNPKATGPMMMMNEWSWLSTEVEWVIQWNIHTFTKGFKNTYQTILDVGYSAWSGTVLTDMQYRKFYAMLLYRQHSTLFCPAWQMQVHCMDVDTLGLSCARAWTHRVSFHFRHWM